MQHAVDSSDLLEAILDDVKKEVELLETKLKRVKLILHGSHFYQEI